jgi:hypothetical protein
VIGASMYSSSLLQVFFMLWSEDGEHLSRFGHICVNSSVKVVEASCKQLACWKLHLEGWFARVCWRACCSAACRIPRGRHCVVVATIWSFVPCQLHAEWMR